MEEIMVQAYEVARDYPWDLSDTVASVFLAGVGVASVGFVAYQMCL